MRTIARTLVFMLVATPMVAQDDPRLVDAVRLLTEGQGDSARAAVQELLRATPSNDPIFPEVVYTAGVVAADLESAQRYFERVAIEFDLSEWADDAMLRLVQLLYTAGNAPGALVWHDRFVRDYPTSELASDIAFWGARSHFDLRQEAQGCAALERGLESVVEGDVELKNRLDFYARRCSATSDNAEVEPPPSRPYFAVQVLAATNVAAVDQVLTELRSAGFEGSVTRDADGLLKVRVGRYATREQARPVAAEIRRRLGGEPFVVEVTP